MSYYPSQGSYRHEQPVYEYPSSHHDYSHSHRHRHHSFGDDYHVQQPTTYEPSHGVGYGYSRHHDFPAAIAVQTAPIVMVCFFSYHCVFAFSTDWTNSNPFTIVITVIMMGVDIAPILLARGWGISLASRPELNTITILIGRSGVLWVIRVDLDIKTRE